MGLRGQVPKPTALLKISGSRKVEKRADDAPSVPGIPDKPEFLFTNARAVELWNEYVETAGTLPGLLSVNDGNALAAACMATAAFERLARELNQQGIMVPDEKKGEVPNPLLRSMREYMEAASRLWAKFGASPADRVRTATAKATNAAHTGLAKFTRSA